MRVAIYYNNSDVRIEERDIPEIGPGEILVKAKACGICGSDVMEWYRIKKAPLILGHEMTGVVEKVGEGVTNFKEGDRVFVSHHVPCMDCKYCKDENETVCDSLRTTNFAPGGFSEYVKVPEINVKHGTFLLPTEISFEEGTLIEPLACVLRGQRKANLKSGNSVLVIGSGVAGMLHVQMAKANGARKIVATDRNDYKLGLVQKFGADEAKNASEELTEKFDRVIICAAALPAIEQGFKSVDKGGNVLLFAPTKPEVNVSLPVWDLWKDCVTVTTSYAGAPRDIKEAIELIRTKKVNASDMITHKLPLEKAQEGFNLAAGSGESVKVVLEI
jgi:L-iditol 2-dehydrogenase